MPYIPQEQRDSLELVPDSSEPGQLTYLLYQTIVNALPRTPKYADYCTILGALQACTLEFYRQHLAPYEDDKLFENGDVY